MLSASLSFNRACLICLQSSKSLICSCCSGDLQTFDMSLFEDDLLNSPNVKLGFSDIDFEQLIALSDYQWPISNLLSRLKFSNQMIAAKALASLFVSNAITPSLRLPDLIIPVPLSSSRFAKRLYNQAGLIAHYVGNHLSVEVNNTKLYRVKNTQPQTHLNGPQRRKNLKNAFSLAGPIDGKHIVVFDDVLTTGSTVNGICRLIKSRYPTIRIDVWAICVTLQHR
jgi:ComF family protein